MPNTFFEPTPLTALSPIKNGVIGYQTYASRTREHLQSLELHDRSPMAKVPNTFLCRFYILNDVFFEGSPAKEDHLKSKYLVFCCNFHGDLDTYLRGFWQHAEEEARRIWAHCVAFDEVDDAGSFVEYIKKCQIKTTFYFNGSTGLPLDQQLKALYLKQEFSAFACDTQGLSPEKMLEAFQHFIARTKPADLREPTWHPGKISL